MVDLLCQTCGAVVGLTRDDSTLKVVKCVRCTQIEKLEHDLAALTASVGRMAAYLGVAHIVKDPTV